jgi:hypothetical protein
MPKKPANRAGKAIKKAIKQYYEALQSYRAQGVIVRLVSQVVRVSVETVRMVAGLSAKFAQECL